MDLDNLNDRLLFAVPKKGRLQQATLDLLSGSDIQFRRDHRLDIALVKNLPIALIFLPAADIPTFVGEGRVDLGITGRDQVAEHEALVPPTQDTGVDEIMDLGFGKCALKVQVPISGSIQTAQDLVGNRVATSFVNLTRSYFDKLEADQKKSVNGAGKDTASRTTTVKQVGGSVETACRLDIADGIVDLVESGDTMRAAGLKAIADVLDSTAILIKSKRPSNPTLVNLIASRIRGVITAQRYVMCTYNISRTRLEAACKITPGKRAPTINPLDEAGWVAVSAMVERKEMAVVMDKLTEVGADDILVTKFENSRTA